MSEPVGAPLADLLARRRFRDVAAGLGTSLWIKRKSLQRSLLSRGKRLVGVSGRLSESHYPSWIDPDFERRLDLRARWRAGMADPAPRHATRRRACRMMSDAAAWAYLFEEHDPGSTSVPAEFRHPLMDLRLVEFVLGIPAVPWAVEKHLLRVAMKGLLPPEVLGRPKTPLAGAPHLEQLKRGEGIPVESVAPPEELGYYVNWVKVPRVQPGDGSWGAWINMRPTTLKLWLLGLR
jgi:asparagine synthase (glutamine-hydrolysing)